MSMLAIPQLDEIVQTAKMVDVFGYGGRRLSSFTTGYDVNIGVSFKPVMTQYHGKPLITLKYQKGE